MYIKYGTLLKILWRAIAIRYAKRYSFLGNSANLLYCSMVQYLVTAGSKQKTDLLAKFFTKSRGKADTRLRWN